MLRDLATGTVRPLTQNWDRSVGSIAWAPDGRSLLVTAEDVLEGPVFRVDAATYATLQARARTEKRVISEIARTALERYLHGASAKG